MNIPKRQVRAVHDADTITVYQAYPPAIADAALRAGRFVAPFKGERMTWIKPSFCWMMYRCGWATKPGQERVLARTRQCPRNDGHGAPEAGALGRLVPQRYPQGSPPE